MTPQTPTPTRSRSDEEGTAILEFALVSVVFLAILYGIISFGVLLAVEHSLTHAAAEGARAAVGTPTAEAVATSEQVTRDAVGWLDGWIEPGDVRAAVAPCAHDTGVDCVEVLIDYPYATRPVLPPFPLLEIVLPDSVRTAAVATIG